MRWCVVVLAGGLAWAQTKPARPLHLDSPSSMDYHAAADGEETVEIRNVSYDVTGTQVPDLGPDQRLLLKKTVRSKQVLGDIGMEGTVLLEAWRLGDDTRQKPLYSLTVTGTGGRTLDNALFVVSRGLEETEWWSIYQLGSGKHLFDTYVPLVSFSISRETLQTRYAGFDVPPDDRLKRPDILGVLSYASERGVIRQALVTCEDPKLAPLLRSYADTTRTLAATDRLLTLSFSRNYPSAADTLELRIAVRGDDLDLAHAQAPPKLHVTPWRR